MVSIPKKNHQNKKQLIQLNKTSIDFIIGNDSNADAIENEALGPQTSGFVKSFGMFTVGETSASQDQVVE